MGKVTLNGAMLRTKRLWHELVLQVEPSTVLRLLVEQNSASGDAKEKIQREDKEALVQRRTNSGLDPSRAGY